MQKLRWVMDSGGFWEMDISTPVTLDGQARPVPGDPLPLGLSRGHKLSRCKQIEFFQRFMAMPFIPSFAPNCGFLIQRVLSIPLAENWSAMLLGQLNVQKLVSSLKKNGLMHPSESSWLQSIKRNFVDKSFYALSLCSEMLLTPDDTLVCSLGAYGDQKMTRKKAVLHHKFPRHNLTVEAASPGLFVDEHGSYWDVPFSLALDLASVSLDSASYHLFLNHFAASPKHSEGQHTKEVPNTLLPGYSAKGAVSFKKTIDLWQSEASLLKMVQPYDLFLSIPHVSASWILGAVVSAYLGDNSIQGQAAYDGSRGLKGFDLRAQGANSAVSADLFASTSLTAQHGSFQRLVLDLTRAHVRLDFPSGSKFLSGASSVAYDLYRSQVPNVEALQAICPRAMLSFQQQIIGPFSFRVDSEIAIDLKKDCCLSVKNPIFAIEHALQVLGSAKAVAWYSPVQQEFMMELRFFET